MALVRKVALNGFSGRCFFRRTALIFYLLLLFPVVLPGAPGPATYSMYILEDRAGTLGFRDVISAPVAQRFDSTIDGKNTQLKHPQSAYWVRFKIRKNTREHLAVRVIFLYSDVQLYIPLGAGKYLVKKGGLYYPFSTRALKTNDLVFPIPHEAREDLFYYARIQVPLSTGLAVGLERYDDIVNQSIADLSQHIFFFGIIFIIGAYNLILFGAIRQKAYLFYGLYVFSLGLFAGVDWGYIKQWYWADRLVWQKMFWSVPFCGMTVFLLLYCRGLLHTRRHLPRLHRLIGLLIGLRLLLLLPSGTMGAAFRYEMYVNDAVLLADNAMPLVAFAAGIARLRKGFRPARYFIAGSALIFSGYLVHTLYLFRVFPWNAQL